MKIKEVLALTQSKRLADVAKEHLNIGEKPARTALKNAGCFSIAGKRGWFFEGDPSILEQNIYDFAHSPRSKTQGERKNFSSKKPLIEKTNKDLLDSSEEQKNNNTSVSLLNKKVIDPNNSSLSESEPLKIERRRSSFDVDVQLLKQVKIQAILEDRNLYELVEDALRSYLKNKNGS